MNLGAERFLQLAGSRARSAPLHSILSPHALVDLPFMESSHFMIMALQTQ